MTTPDENEVTQLLIAWSEGDESALEKLIPVIHSELYRLARLYMSKERQGHSLQTSALVNEAYMKLINWKTARWENRAHFFGVSAQLMRRSLVDFARRRARVKDVSTRQVSLDKALTVFTQQDDNLVALDDALTGLAKFDPRKSRVVELRFFGGMSVEETATFLKISEATVVREWNSARAWLYRELSGESEDAS